MSSTLWIQGEVGESFVEPIFRLDTNRQELRQLHQTGFRAPGFTHVSSLRVVHFHFRGIAGLRTVSCQLRRLCEDVVRKDFLFGGISNDNVRAAVIADVHPEIFGVSYLKGQGIVFPAVAADEDLVSVDGERTMPRRSRFGTFRRIWSAVSFHRDPFSDGE